MASSKVSFTDKLTNKWNEGKFVCIGLDSDYTQLPLHLKKNNPPTEAVFKFNKEIIDTTYDYVLAYKFQSAFYEALGAQGFLALKKTCEYLQENYPDIPLIYDAKRADVPSTSEQYAKACFDTFGFDAITVNPYLGKDALEPFLKREDKGVIVLVKTSNEGSGEFQNLKIRGEAKLLYQTVATQVSSEWNTNGNCAVVVGATHPRELKDVRKIVKDMPILVPGIGAQGGDLKDVLINGLNSKGRGLIISLSRSIIFASSGIDFAKAAQKETLTLNGKISYYINNFTK